MGMTPSTQGAWHGLSPPEPHSRSLGAQGCWYPTGQHAQMDLNKPEPD